MRCDDVRGYVFAYLDSELDATTAHDVAQHLAGCERCAARLNAEEQLESQVALRLRSGDVDDVLWARLLRDALDGQRGRVRAGLRRVPRPALAALLAVGCIVGCIVGWWMLRGSVPPETDAGLDLARAVFADRDSYSPEIGFVPDIAPPSGVRGYRFVGGRHCTLEGMPVQILLGTVNATPVTLFVGRRVDLWRFPEAQAALTAEGQSPLARRLPDGCPFVAAVGSERIVFGVGMLPTDALADIVQATRDTPYEGGH